MKRTLIAAAAMLAAGAAFAQSSVTLYGRVNTSVEYQTTKPAGGSSSHVTALQNNASRWGLRGSEDLGGGFKGLFVLESGFSSDTGAGTSRLFGRESWVGLQTPYGRLRLGNMGPSAAYYTTADYISMHNHDTGTSSDAFYLYPGVMQNTVAFNTVSYGGLTVEGQYGLKQTVDPATGIASESNAGTYSGVLAVNYDRGPLHLGASFVDSTSATLDGVTGTDGKEYGLRALYELGAFTVGAYYVRNEVDNGTPEAKRDSYRVSAMYTLGGSEFHVNVGYADKIKRETGTKAASDAIQYTVAYNYNLSKRTKVYAFYTKVDNKAAATYSAFGNTVAGGTDTSSFALGVRHNF
ncbi:porin [uncultured Azohydromonas sp.]|jgi:Outer membrane protein (porin)|uniref:porin n=1 Tax=uncultured Azohydromonas sp. TaxID=487342 RepID=UPI0026375053|nr:porin [uncultured Azohydromonas sp.]